MSSCGHVADEPRVGVVGRRPGLAGGRSPERRPRAGAVLHVLLEDLRHDGRLAVREHALALRTRPAGARVDGAVREHDLADRRRLRADAAGSDRRVGRRHVERRHRDRAEPERRDIRAVDVERRRHAEALRHRGDAGRGDVECQLRVHRVVRSQRRPLDRRPADVRRVVRLHAPPRAVVAVAVGDRPVRERRRDVVVRHRVDAHVHGRGQHEGLERRARLAPRLREQVELVVAPAGDHGRHRADRARRRLDRDDRRRRIGALVQHLADRLLRESLVARDDRRVDLETARPDRLGAVRRRSAGRGRSRRSTARGSACRDGRDRARVADLPPSRAAPRDLAHPQHRVEHLRAAGQRLGRRDEGVEGRRRLDQPGQQRRLGSVSERAGLRSTSAPPPRRRRRGCRSRPGSDKWSGSAASTTSRSA